MLRQPLCKNEHNSGNFLSSEKMLAEYNDTSESGNPIYGIYEEDDGFGTCIYVKNRKLCIVFSDWFYEVKLRGLEGKYYLESDIYKTEIVNFTENDADSLINDPTKAKNIVSRLLIAINRYEERFTQLFSVHDPNIVLPDGEDEILVGNYKIEYYDRVEEFSVSIDNCFYKFLSIRGTGETPTSYRDLDTILKLYVPELHLKFTY